MIARVASARSGGLTLVEHIEHELQLLKVRLPCHESDPVLNLTKLPALGNDSIRPTMFSVRRRRKGMLRFLSSGVMFQLRTIVDVV